MHTRRVHQGTVAICAVALVLLVGCGTDVSVDSGPVAAPREATPDTTPTVGDSVSIPSGVVTLERVTRTNTTGPGATKHPSIRWMYFRFTNTSDATVTVSGFRGAPPPVVTGADGSVVDVDGKQTKFEGGTGGWGLGYPEAVYLGPNGFVTAGFLVRPVESQYRAGSRPLTVEWQPTDRQSATFQIN